MCTSATHMGLTLRLSMLESGLVWMDKALWSKKKSKLLFHYYVCGLWPGSRRQCEHSLLVSPLSSPSHCVTQRQNFPLSGKIQSTPHCRVLPDDLLYNSMLWHCVAQISPVIRELLAAKLEKIHQPVEKNSPWPITQGREKEMDLQERSVHLCFCFIVSQIVCASIHTTRNHKVWQIKGNLQWFLKNACLLVAENWSGAAPFLPQEHARRSSGSSTSSNPHSGARSRSASSFALFSGAQVRAVDRNLNYCDSAALVCHDSQPCGASPAPCPACLVVSSPAKQGLQHLQEGDIRLVLLSSPPAPCSGSCSPASRESHWKEMLKLVSRSASQFVPQTRRFLLLLLPLS